MRPAPPVALSIAGSDPSAGAGIQADLKAFSANGVYGLTAITCTTAQVPGRVASVAAVGAAHLREQIDLLLGAYPVAAVKTGMLFSAELVDVVAGSLRDHARDVPLVVDPVMVATSGDPLLRDDAIDAYRTTLLPMASLFTPNLDEARALLGGAPITRSELQPAALELASRYRSNVLLKGGHLRDGRATDVLVLAGRPCLTFDAPFVEGVSTHGTGCTYSAAIAAHLAGGESIADAVAHSKAYVSAAIAATLRWDTGAEALDHFPRQDDQAPRA